MAYGVIVVLPDGEIQSWGTDDEGTWQNWCRRLFDECEYWQDFEYFAWCM